MLSTIPEAKHYDEQQLRLRLAWALYGFDFLIKTLREINDNGNICRCSKCHIQFRRESSEWSTAPVIICTMKQFLFDTSEQFAVSGHFEDMPHRHSDALIPSNRIPYWVWENTTSSNPGYTFNVHLVIDTHIEWNIQYGKLLWNTKTVEEQLPYFRMVHHLDNLANKTGTSSFAEWFNI